jgi:glycosyltransferase involved in cell wall biosynthesis|tara:strand:+ start:225 stop:1226 length:1002 start_codon:yes stop_codon:yes gene_type:complete
MITKIYFIENSFDYNALNLNDNIIAGSEKTLINITNELGKNSNLSIKVFNNTTKPQSINNVQWLNISQIEKNDTPDFVVSMSDANLFYKLSAKKNYLWSHSVQNFEKFLRKSQLIPFIKFKPMMILEGDYHYKTRGFFTSFYGKSILKIAADYDFINAKIDINFIPPANVIFTTRSDRNLKFLIQSWFEIKKYNDKAKLFINPPHILSQDEKINDIIVRNKSNKQLLINELLNTRLFLSPGHIGEVFCLAAEEARVLCIPIVTMGHGALYERVEHNVTGFIASNQDDLIKYSNNILNDEGIFKEFRKNLFNKKNSRNYNNVKKDFLKILGIND